MNKQYRTLVNPNLPVLMLEVQALVQDGWVLDEDNLPCAYHTYYEAHLWKVEEAEKQVVMEPVKRVGRTMKALSNG